MHVTEPVPAQALFERARELIATQKAEEAEEVIREGLRRYPGDRDIQSWLATALLMQGKLRDGFREYESRSPRQEVIARQLAIPEWDGPIAGRSILIWGEQGIGDELQIARFITTLRALGASRIYVACLDVNVRVFQQIGAELVINRMAQQLRVPPVDCWIKAWSIPYRLGLSLDDISGKPYLTAEPSSRGGVGLVERGNPDNPRDLNRSIPQGMLQRAVPQGRLIEPVGDTCDSLRQLAGLDLLITVDTSWAHMAGALGVPCWLLLPFRDLDWRWLRERPDTPWYRSLRLFRQGTPGDWAGVIREVVGELRER